MDSQSSTTSKAEIYNLHLWNLPKYKFGEVQSQIMMSLLSASYDGLEILRPTDLSYFVSRTRIGKRKLLSELKRLMDLKVVLIGKRDPASGKREFRVNPSTEQWLAPLVNDSPFVDFQAQSIDPDQILNFAVAHNIPIPRLNDILFQIDYWWKDKDQFDDIDLEPLVLSVLRKAFPASGHKPVNIDSVRLRRSELKPYLGHQFLTEDDFIPELDPDTLETTYTPKIDMAEYRR